MMIMPPKHDPLRTLRAAVVSTGLLSVVFVLIGFIAAGMLFSNISRSGIAAVRWRGLASAAFYVGSSVAYLLCAIYLGQRKRWAALLGAGCACAQLLALLIGVTIAGISVIVDDRFDAFMIIPMVLVAIFAADLVLVIVLLIRSLDAIRQLPAEDGRRGFELHSIGSSNDLSMKYFGDGSTSNK